MKRSLTMVVLLLPFLFAGMFTGHAMDEGQKVSKRGWLGVSTSDMTPRLARSMHVKTNEGALVKEIPVKRGQHYPHGRLALADQDTRRTYSH